MNKMLSSLIEKYFLSRISPRSGDTAQLIEHLPSMNKVLGLVCIAQDQVLSTQEVEAG